MKITQELIDQAAMIANAKVGDELEESVRSGSFRSPIGAVVLNSTFYTYRIKPQPRTIWVNEYPSGGRYTYKSKKEAIDMAAGCRPERTAVEYREVIE